MSINTVARQRVYSQSTTNFALLPNLIEIQKNSFDWFLKTGLPEELRSFSSIVDYSDRLELHFLQNFHLGTPKHTEEECRNRDYTFSAPLRIAVQLVNKISNEVKDSEIFIGDLPLMTDRGTFIINGAERVVVSQIVRSPGVYFKKETDISGKRIYTATIIPNRGVWLKFEIDANNIIYVRVDKNRKILATTLLRAIGYQTHEMLSHFKYKEFIQLTLDKECADKKDLKAEDALLEIYKKLRPGDPPSVEGGRAMLHTRFFDAKRYDLGRVGRHKMNKKLNIDVPLETRTLTEKDLISVVDYLVNLYFDVGSVDDIDHLGNRRIRSVGELLQNQFRVGLTRIERIVKERMTIQDIDRLAPHNLINSKPLVAAIKEFFGSSQLSQFMDQTNPLAELTHKRRLSALGPGGLNRERAGFAVRDIHKSHYGRICPIETPEGPNAGLISSLSTFARINEFGFIQTPYWKVKDGKRTEELKYLSADDEEGFRIASGDVAFKEDGSFLLEQIPVRFKNEFYFVDPRDVDYVGVSPVQIVSIATSLIPFLEHDDANRALMGSNMQRQSVPLINPDRPLVGTGIEARAAQDSGITMLCKEDGEVTRVTANEICIKSDSSGLIKTYKLIKFFRSNQDTCSNQKPIVRKGDKVRKGQVIADGAATDNGELALGQNITVAFMPWEGYNYEDAILLSERLVWDDTFTSIHIEKYETEARATKLGDEEITREIPNVGEEALKNLDENGIIRVGAEIEPGDILVGKTTPKGESEHPPEEKLLRAIFGEKARDCRDTSLHVPHGEKGRVVDVKIFRRDAGDELPPGVNQVVRVFIAQKRKISVGDKIAGRHGNKGIVAKILPREDMPFLPDGTPVDIVLNPLGVPSRMNMGQIFETLLGWAASMLGTYLEVSPFDEMFEQEASRNMVRDYLRQAREKTGVNWITEDGKILLHDGRTGEPFDNPVTVGSIYIMKLVHLVDDKIHARSTGPYSLVTQQPLGGKAQFGGQRFGEMEVWALEAYGAAYSLQEILTIKSDDVTGRAAAYEAIVKGKNIQKPGIPESFKVLIRELQSICLDIQVIRMKDGQELEMPLFEEDRATYRSKLKQQFAKVTGEFA